jgi:taurine dioxygenase
VGEVGSIAADVQFRKVGGRIGAEVGGVDLSGSLADNDVTAIRDALWEHKVLFFRRQETSTDASLVAFGERLGSVLSVAEPNAPVREDNKVVVIKEIKEYKTDHWHMDATFATQPPGISMLWPVVLPEYGGDTLWANAAAGYLDLPSSLRDLADQLWVVHSNRYQFADPRALDELPPVPGASDGDIRWFTFMPRPFETVHPAVSVHPESGQRALLLGTHAQHVVGFPQQIARHLIEILQYYITRPENVVRWRWQTGDVALWDNRLALHYAPSDYDGQERTLHRVSLQGSEPASPDGERFSSGAEAVPYFADQGSRR